MNVLEWWAVCSHEASYEAISVLTACVTIPVDHSQDAHAVHACDSTGRFICHRWRRESVDVMEF